MLSVVRKTVALWLSGSAETVNALVNSESARLALKQVRSIRVFRSKYGHSLPAFYDAFFESFAALEPWKTGTRATNTASGATIAIARTSTLGVQFQALRPPRSHPRRMCCNF